MEKFYEISIGPGSLKSYKNFKILNIVSYGIAVLLFLNSVILGILAFITLSIPTFILRKKSYAEYDYEFNSGEFTISCVYEKSKRKEIVNIVMKDIKSMEPSVNKDLKNLKIKRCYNEKCNGKKPYIILEKNNSKGYEVMLDEKMTDLCYFSNPQVVRK